ncbi:hypothetical protein PG996_009437 [Apiospora saccharicola]|uniref:Uncharacterized protein n=1 Tax=Apiospora saccharicola TaxID=335842 RepID=A0ABR1UKS2_9PEZI
MYIQETFDDIPDELTTNLQRPLLRTVYTPESNALLPSVIVKLERWMSQYHLHINRFPFWGESGEAERKKRSNGSVNNELGRRFQAELHASQQDICALCDVFDARVASVGHDPHAESSPSPRFCDSLVIDEESLRSLVEISEEPPRLHVAADSEEKRNRGCLSLPVDMIGEGY